MNTIIKMEILINKITGKKVLILMKKTDTNLNTNQTI